MSAEISIGQAPFGIPISPARDSLILVNPHGSAVQVTAEFDRHRYEFNNQYRELFDESQMLISGRNPDRDLVEIIELPEHPFFIGVQFHPEFQSSPLAPHAIFNGFVAAALDHSRGGNHQRLEEASLA